MSGYDVCNMVVPYIDSMRVHLVTPFIILALLFVAWGVVVIIGLLHSFDKCSCCCRHRCCVRNFNYESRQVVSFRAVSISLCILRLMVPGIGARGCVVLPVVIVVRRSSGSGFAPANLGRRAVRTRST